MTEPSDVEELRDGAATWLRENAEQAPPDYGRQPLAELITRGWTDRALAQRQGAGTTTAGSLLDLGITEMGFDAAMLRGHLVGIDSVLDGPGASGMLAAPGGRIAGGTSQVQRNIIAERLLGLPREPKRQET